MVLMIPPLHLCNQEMVWMLVNNVDKEKGSKPASLRCPYMEIHTLMGPDHDKIPFPPDMIEVMNNPIGYAEKMSSPRVLKTHLPISSLPHGTIFRNGGLSLDMTF